MLRPKIASSTTAPTRKRQKEMFSGLKPCWLTKTFTTKAPVPQSTPAAQAATKAQGVELEEGEVTEGLLRLMEMLGRWRIEPEGTQSGPSSQRSSRLRTLGGLLCWLPPLSDE